MCIDEVLRSFHLQPQADADGLTDAAALPEAAEPDQSVVPSPRDISEFIDRSFGVTTPLMALVSVAVIAAKYSDLNFRGPARFATQYDPVALRQLAQG
jgi:hypothetical protein